MQKLLVPLMLSMLVTGCATTSLNNVESFNFIYYKKLANESNNIKNTKAFLAENNIKFNIYSIVDNVNTGSFGSILINGKRISFANKENNVWYKERSIDLENNELSSFYFRNNDRDIVKPLKNGKYFNTVYCADFTHAELSPNNETLVFPFTYLLTAMTKDNVQLAYSTSKSWNCDGYEFGDVIYKKTIRVSSTLNSARTTYDLKKGETVLNDSDKFNLITGDAIKKASIEKLNDAEMLQAWKDYLVTVNNSTNEVKVKQETKPVIKQEPAAELNGLDDAKYNCKELGFKAGSKEFGNCVFKLAK